MGDISNNGRGFLFSSRFGHGLFQIGNEKVIAKLKYNPKIEIRTSALMFDNLILDLPNSSRSIRVTYKVYQT